MMWDVIQFLSLCKERPWQLVETMGDQVILFVWITYLDFRRHVLSTIVVITVILWHHTRFGTFTLSFSVKKQVYFFDMLHLCCEYELIGFLINSISHILFLACA